MTAGPSSTFPASLPCDAILYRLLTKGLWIDPDGGIAPGAFYRRPDEEGISVFIAATCSLDEAKSVLNEVKGIATLHTGRIRDIGLEAAPDPIDARHAEIVGVPSRDDDEGLATYYADLLAEQARLVWKRQS